MKTEWKNCRNILCIRPDNIGDLLMSTPAIRALKETMHCKITVLTSSMAAGVARCIPEVDEIIRYDLPWVKSDEAFSSDGVYSLVKEITTKNFDAAVVFTVYSQNPLPSVMLAYLAGIPLRLSYCRENPYALLTDWIPDREPYSCVEHQVRRDLNLVQCIGAFTSDENLSLDICAISKEQVENKLQVAGVDLQKPWLVVHPGVSESKREYPLHLWQETCKKITSQLGYQVLLTGTVPEKRLTNFIREAIGERSFSLAGILSLVEFMRLIELSPVVVSVNTATTHIAAALKKPVVVLYALTNPQHSPWKTKGKVLPYEIPEELKSRNEVIRFASERLHPREAPMVTPDEIVNAVREVLLGKAGMIPEMIALQNNFVLSANEYHKE